MRSIPFDYALYGRPGSPIKGSSYYREYCKRCGEPMRVTQGRVGQNNYCEACDPPHIGVGNHIQTSRPDQDPDAYEPAWKAD